MANTATLQDDITTRFRDRLAETLGRQKVQLWLNGQTRLELTDDAQTLRIAVPSRFAADRLRAPATLAALRQAADAFETRPQVRIEVQNAPATPVTEAVVPEAPRKPAPRRRVARHPFADTGLRHKLDDFVVGSCNELAYAAAVRLAEADPSDASVCGVPLYIHGGCGLGKTHLLQGICRRWAQRKPGAKVLYTTGEQFTNRYIDHAQRGKLDQFRKQMRSIDLLCVDDVHFIAGKAKTQTEFLHSFDAIELCGAPVVMASDQHPRLIKQFGEALTSRCLRGLVIEVEKPDDATRRSLVVALAARRGMVLPAPAVDLLALQVGDTVREIEGVLTKLHALASLKRAPASSAAVLPVDMAMVHRLIETEQREAPARPATVPAIARAVADCFGLSPREVLGSARQRPIVMARSLVVRLAKEMTPMSYPEIARAMGRPNHSSVITADKRIKQRVADGSGIEVPGRPEPVPAPRLIDELKRAVRLADTGE